MTTASTTSGTSDACPYCGKPYGTFTIPSFLGVPERVVTSTTCGCDGEREAMRAKAHEAAVRKREDAMRKIGIPEAYWDVPEDDRWLDAIADGGLMVYGLSGRGKTYLAVGALKAWLNRHQGCRARFADSMELYRRIKAAYTRGDGDDEAKVPFISPDILVLDDVGKGVPGEWGLSTLEDIVNTRVARNRPTIFTSQWSGRELVERLSAGGPEESAVAIAGRISGSCQPVELRGPDLRMARAKKAIVIEQVVGGG